jgi:hypothetical protein
VQAGFFFAEFFVIAVQSLLTADAPHSPPRSVTDRLSQIQRTLPSNATRSDDAGIDGDSGAAVQQPALTTNLAASDDITCEAINPKSTDRLRFSGGRISRERVYQVRDDRRGMPSNQTRESRHRQSLLRNQ